MLSRMYQVFSSLQGHLHFFGHFSFTFMEYFFFDHPILKQNNKKKKSIQLKCRSYTVCHVFVLSFPGKIFLAVDEDFFFILGAREVPLN